MVYDPIRDVDVPSPATALPPSDGWRRDIPSSSPFHEEPRLNGTGDHGEPSGGMPGHVWPGQETASGQAAPHFYHAASQSPSMPMARRSISGGLRGLLNDDDQTSRRSSAHTASSADDDHRPSIHRLLNETPAQPSIPKSTSSGSITSASEPPSSVSPRVHHRAIDPSAFLTPSTTTRSTRSPHPINTSISPAVVPSPLPFHDPYTPQQGTQPHAGPSRRYSHTTPAHQITGGQMGQRPMLPPETIPRQEYFDYSRITPGAAAGTGGSAIPHSAPLQSPSMSLSPRSLHQPLPSSSSRPGSSAGVVSNQAFTLLPTSHSLDSPSTFSRRLSEDPQARSSSRAPSEVASIAGPGPGSRRASLVLRRGSLASTRTPPVRSPSPAKIPYDPQRISEPNSVLEPITPDEISRLRSLSLTNNPLRRKRRAAPSWSATPGPATVSAARSTPGESDQSYFPPQHDALEQPQKGRRGSIVPRRDSVSSGRPSLTPGPALPAVPEQDDHLGPARKGGAKRKGTAVTALEGSHSKRPSEEADGGGGQRRKLTEGHFVGNSNVANHSSSLPADNARPEVGVQSRELSPIIGLKKFNNWIKSVLIGKFAFRSPGGGARVLDIGCGKGGDLNKWKQARIRLYVGLDIADMSIDQARERYRTMRGHSFEGHFFAYDCYSQPIANILPDPLRVKDLYDNVTMQFCMHYAFESANKARMMMENVSRFLRPGGLFIGTIPDADMLLAKLAEVPDDSPDLRFGNSCYFIEFEQRSHKGVYGHAYRFYLEDAVDDVPEYLVDWENFVNLAYEYRLRLVYKKAFNEILTEEQGSRDFGPLLGKMGVVDADGASAMDGDQWEAANLYMAFAFEKF